MSSSVASASASASASGIKTFRFEFSKPFIQELSRFSKVHQYDERHTYKKEWSAWKSDQAIAEIMEMEKRRLEENGYTGNIEEKMFKSGRYYFRKKSAANAATATPQAVVEQEEEQEDADADADADDDDDNEEPATPTTPATTPTAKSQRKPYITMSKQCIKMMDAHITKHSTTPHFKPSSCYDNFYNENMASAEMAAEIEKIIEKYENVRRTQQPLNVNLNARNAAQTVEDITNEIMDKIKKTYKNRYYRFVNTTTTAADK